MPITHPKTPLPLALLFTIGLLLPYSSSKAASPDTTQLKTTLIEGIQSLITQKRYSGALNEILKQLEHLKPEDQQYQQLVQLQAITLAAQGRHKTAGKLFQQLIDHGQANPATYLNLARLQLTKNQLQASEHTLQQGLKHYPSNSLLHTRHIQLLLLKTRSAIDQARQQHPQDRELLRSRNIISGLLLPRKQLPKQHRLGNNTATTANNKHCYRLGPYRDSNTLQTHLAQLKQRYPDSKITTTHATQGQLQQLLAIGFNSHQQAQQTLQALHQRGLRDIGLTRHTDYGPALSLGVFRLPASLQRRKAQVAQANLQLVDITLAKPTGQYLKLQLPRHSQAPSNAKLEDCPR